MGTVVIAAYRPKPGCAAALLALTHDHVARLRRLGLVTSRPNLVLRGADDTIVEVFEWTAGGIERAHAMPEIHALWAEYAAVCHYTALRDLPESATVFATFAPLDPAAGTAALNAP